MHTRIPGANLAKNAAEEAGREGGGASRRAALNGVARDSPGLVRQGVGVLTSAMSGVFGWVSRSTAFVKMSAGIARCIVMSSLMLAHLTNIVASSIFLPGTFAPGILVCMGLPCAAGPSKQVL